MANNVTHNMNNKAYKLQQTSYDTRQAINNRPIGVIKYNSEIRDALLRRNIGNISPNDSNTGIGYISKLYSNESSKPTSLGEDGLLGYTHIYQSDYQQTINKRYGIGKEITYYDSNSTPVNNTSRWNGEYDDYVKYISDYFDIRQSSSVNLLSELFSDDKLKNIGNGNINSSYADYRNAIYDIIQYDNIRYAMEKTRIGTITPNPIAAFSGVITTNINNMSGKDTPLGVLTNFFYANALNNDAHFNSLRKTRYITPEAYSLIGNKLNTISLLGADLRTNDNTGRISFDRAYKIESYEGLKIDDYKADGEEIADSNYGRYINLIKNPQEFNQRYLPFIDKHYVQKPSRSLLFTNRTQSTYNSSNKILYSWNEGTKINIDENIGTTNGFGIYKGFTPTSDDSSLLHKTQELFRKKEDANDKSKTIDTIVGRFHTEGKTDKTHNEANLFQTAISVFGMSHGRNLLSSKAYKSYSQVDLDKINGYSNPYCRAWTYHHQYDNIGNLIRPFGVEYVDTDGKTKSYTLSISDLQKRWNYGRPGESVSHLSSNTTLAKNGFVNITPPQDGANYDIKKCMFSIENLAWKDVAKTTEKNLSKEQQGPNGGRIMWFPPYDLKFNENVSVNWNQTEFIGRGEKIYTYTNTERSGTLSFILLVDHPSILDAWKANKDSDDDEQTLLRFFAGCEVLETDGVSTQGWKQYAPEEQIKNEEPVPQKANEVFYIFFPHNYSGKNDSLDDAVKYLATKYAVIDKGGNENTETGKPKYRVDKDTQFLKGLGTIDSNKEDNNTLKCNKDIDSLKTNKDYEDATKSFQEISGYVDGNTDKPKKINYTEGKEITKVIISSYQTDQEYVHATGDTNGDGKIDEGKGETSKASNSVTNSNKKRDDRDELSERRYLFAKKFIKRKLDIDEDVIEKQHIGTIPVENHHMYNVSAKSPVLGRCVKVQIHYKDLIANIRAQIAAIIAELQGTDKTFEGKDTYSTETSYEKLEKILKAAQKVQKKSEREKNRAERKKNRQEKRHDRKCSRKHPKIDCEGNESTLMESINDVTRPNNLGQEGEEGEEGKGGSGGPKEIVPIDGRTLISGFKTKEATGDKQRWEKEAEYFTMLADNDTFLYSRLVDKIKYFTPAFHSITPEGFNARLAFLHQCTRQGQTYGVSDNFTTGSAGNLAFGRPPICVLRIGDFYYTKIVIDSITIDYENPQWDMNPEGIGMQPMFARISLNFKFLGGSDIEAPIARLQNAVSFNYYANQSIYDDRADKGQYADNKAKIKGTPWNPTT
jgi:hypothetical protein